MAGRRDLFLRNRTMPGVVFDAIDTDGFQLSSSLDRDLTYSSSGGRSCITLRLDMAKQFNGIFREWLKFKSPDDRRTTIIWGRCIVHLSNPKFSGNVIHTSKVLRINRRKTFSIVETRNSHYVVLGPELKIPTGETTHPRDFVLAHRPEAPSPDQDGLLNAAINADPGCVKCGGTGVYSVNPDRTAICDRCCKHNVGWWQLEGGYGPDNGRWACKAGCGTIVDRPPAELEFLPRTTS